MRTLPISALFGLLVWLGVACGPELSAISKLDSLRILAVRKSAPYAAPGEVVDLELFWEGGELDEVERFFGFWCVNPPGDAYGECLNTLPTVPPSFAFNQDHFSIQLPDNIVREEAHGSGEAAYGTAFVFYGVCRGHLEVNGQPVAGLGPGGGGEGGDEGDRGAQAGSSSAGTSSGGTPNLPAFSGIPECVDDQGEPLDSAGFVVGYSQIFAYEQYRNENPIVTGFEVNGREVEVDCLNSDCIGRPYVPEPATGCTANHPCFKTCAGDQGSACESQRIRPIVDRASAEKDQVSLDTFGTDIEESLWVSYFTDQGHFDAELRLVNDATTGWNEDQTTGYFGPKEPGPVGLWAVVRDNRGGVSFARVRGYAEASE
jgi:hypothetical protein